MAEQKNEVSVKTMIIGAVAVASSLFYIIALNFIPTPANIFRSMAVLSACILGILLYPAGNSKKAWFLDVLLIALSIATFVYALIEVDDVMERGGLSNTDADLIFGTVAVLIVLEITRRIVGWALPLIAMLFIAYAAFGFVIPGELGHRGYSYSRVISTLYTYDGILGMPTAVAATFVAMFLVFGAILEATGAGNFFMDLARGLAGNQRGGPAKIATVSSAFFGTISGSAVANVAATGTFTIPMMKRIGYSPTFAGAVESTASTGGQIMPPVMAAGAFIMAEILATSYVSIMKAALVPAILFFVTVWITIDLRAAKLGLKGIPRAELPSVPKLLLSKGYILTPLVVLLIMLILVKSSPIKAAFWAMVSTLVVSYFRRETMLSPMGLVKALDRGGRSVIKVIAPCACAGIVVGAVGLTGFGMKIASLIMAFSGGIQFIALMLSMVVALLFGMGLPTTVSYLLCVAVLAPALIEMGILPIAAHLFIFYFACLSGITPPVGLAAFTGAGIAGSPPMETAFQAVKLSIAAFILPYMFCYHSSFLLMGSVVEIGQAILTALLGCWAIVVFLEGWLFGKCDIVVRLVFLSASLCLIYPGWKSDIAGVTLLTVGALLSWFKVQNEKKAVQAEVISK